MKKIALLTLSALLLLAGCSEDWLDVNTDPNSPSEVNINQLLPAITVDMASDFSLDFMALGYITSTYTHQIVSREGIDNYGIGSADIDWFWNDLFSNPMSDINLLISKAEETDNMAYAGIARIYKAYLTSMMVDLWGDIPFSQFGNISEYPNPEFDNDQAIYEACFALLDEGIEDLGNTESENSIMPGDDDLIYGGDTDSWIILANTIKLKLYNQVRLTSLYNATEVNSILASGDIISSYNDNFMLWFGTSDAPENRNPGFTEYTGAQISTYISPWFYEIMTGQNPDILNGVSDPRVPYYWINQLHPGNPDPENNTEYRDGYFVSIYFGSQSTARDAGGRRTFTMVGLYPVGGKYDDGTGGTGGDDNTTVESSDAAGDAPYRFITYADVLFIQAELQHAGLVSGDPRTTLEAAIRAAFEQVDNIASESANAAPALDQTDIDNYVADVLAEYDGVATADERLEIIMTQKWISQFGNGIDQYTDYRRTGYPRLFDPSVDPHDGGPDTDLAPPVDVVVSRGYPLSFPWGQQEKELNQNAPDSKVVTTANLFWDI